MQLMVNMRVDSGEKVAGWAVPSSNNSLRLYLDQACDPRDTALSLSIYMFFLGGGGSAPGMNLQLFEKLSIISLTDLRLTYILYF